MATFWAANRPTHILTMQPGGGSSVLLDQIVDQGAPLVSSDPAMCDLVRQEFVDPGVLQERDGIIGQITNLVPNPSFELGVSNWAPSGNSAGISVPAFLNASEAGWSKFGAKSVHYRVTRNDAVNTTIVYRNSTGTSGIPVVPGATYFSGYWANVLAIPAGRNNNVAVYWYKSDGTSSTIQSSSIGQSSVNGALGEMNLGSVFTAPSDAAFASPCFRTVLGNGATETWEGYLDGFVFYPTTYASSYIYSDGSMPYYGWSGTPNLSSTYVLT